MIRRTFLSLVPSAWATALFGADTKEKPGKEECLTVKLTVPIFYGTRLGQLSEEQSYVYFPIEAILEITDPVNNKEYRYISFNITRKQADIINRVSSATWRKLISTDPDDHLTFVHAPMKLSIAGENILGLYLK